MTVNLGLLVVVGITAACGVYLLLERSLIRMLLGMLLVGNAINLMILVISGGTGNPPIFYRTSAGRKHDADPLAQGMVLTAIVISMGVAAFILALAYRSFVLNREDEVADDPEDVKITEQSLSNAPDRDRSDDPVTLSDTAQGDAFDASGRPLSPEEIQHLHELHEMDIIGDEPDATELDPDDPDLPSRTEPASTDGGDR